ncbi:MAG: tRNA (adenosine(37)-N6)-threonylcarbamoyltransferase complex ATPase subunit type 1 TsaE [Verrucomicrobia bacterium]|nr:tRNA (adenosine(37)-N6)-threonylcarbamoyltransferase complex ATPase subunit type 1 TsaE [Verrucomicrobiota bacterium]
MKTATTTSKHITRSVEDTLALGERLAALLPAGTVVALSGDLGAGKTALTKGVARGLGVSDTITSPTFALVNEHDARDGRRLYHVDLYRLDRPQQAVDIGIEEELTPDGWTIIEWAEKLGDVLPANAVRIDIEIVGENERRITVRGVRNLES